jgi:Sulfotransferase family
MKVVEILEVRTLSQDSELLRGFALNSPETNSGNETYNIKIAGWVVGSKSKVNFIEIISDGQVLRTIPVKIWHADVAERFAASPGSGQCGFWALVGVLGQPSNFTISLQAVFSDEARLPLAEIQCRWNFAHSFEPNIRPLLVTSLGRTGTTWLMRLLSEHSRIVTYPRHPYEFRFARYWMHVLKVLSEPADHQKSSHPDSFQSDYFFVGHNPFFTGRVADASPLGQWFGRSYVDGLAVFAQGTIEDCYKQIGEEQGRPDPIYFAEKHLPDHLPLMMRQIYSETREIILVRDFRDMVCSLLAFNLKRGYHAFGRQQRETDSDFIRQLSSGVSKLRTAWEQRSTSAHLVRYEDLVLKPIQTLLGIFQYLDLERTPSLLKGILNVASQESSESMEHKTSPSPSASISRWKSDLNPELSKLCEELFQDSLKTFGYA